MEGRDGRPRTGPPLHVGAENDGARGLNRGTQGGGSFKLCTHPLVTCLTQLCSVAVGTRQVDVTECSAVLSWPRVVEASSARLATDARQRHFDCYPHTPPRIFHSPHSAPSSLA